MVKMGNNGKLKRYVLNIYRMTTHNGPGIRTLIQFKGCPLHCLWCSTPESQKEEPEIALDPTKCILCNKCIPSCPLNAIKIGNEGIGINRLLCNNCGKCTEVCYTEAIRLLGQAMTVEELLEEVKRDEVFYKHSEGGVTLSGGEPLLKPDFTRNLLLALKAERISVGIDTCGYVPWEDLEPLVSYIDFCLWDIKHMNPDVHKELTGVSNELILNNVSLISDRNIPIYIRIPIISGYNDSEDNIRATCKFAQSLSTLVTIDLMPLHHLGKARYESLDRKYPLSDMLSVPDSTLQKIKQLIQSCGIKYRIIT